ncbi:hypothetical protein GHY26_21310 [Salmonella enterica]|nr:hypothetical protein [Salmonella enterica subsp. diarizonae serovar 65:(k):z]
MSLIVLWRKKLNTTAHTMWGVSGRLILVLLNNRQLPWLLLVQYESTIIIVWYHIIYVMIGIVFQLLPIISC